MTRFFLAVIEFVVTPVGRVVAVAILAFGAGHHWAASSHAAREAELRLAQEMELAREQEAAREIAAAATDRAEADAAAAKRQQAVISNLVARESFNVRPIAILSPTGVASPDPLFLDPDFRGVVHQFDAAALEAGSPRDAGASQKSGYASRPGQCAALKIFALRNRDAAAQANRKVEGWNKFYESVRREFGK